MKKENKTEKKETVKIKCTNCKKEWVETKFYMSNSPMFPSGRVPLCKDCIKKIIDYNNIETVYQVLRTIDIPFFYDYWQTCVKKNPMNPFGNYIRMANSGINEFSGARWANSYFEPKKSNDINNNLEKNEESDKRSYSNIWRGSYNESDLEYLEEYYRDLNNDFKIVTKNHKDYARKIAKASLAMDKAYEDMLNGVSGSDKRYKDLKDTFDQLSKSAQFSENTRGANDVSLGCFGVLFDKVEQKKWIPIHVPLEKDDYDKMLDAFSSINKSL